MPLPLPVRPDLFGGFNPQQMPEAYNPAAPTASTEGGTDYLQSVSEDIVTPPNDGENPAYTDMPAPSIDQSEGAQEMASAIASAGSADDITGAGIYGGVPARPPVMGEGSNYLGVGGPFGRDMVNEAFNVQPKRLAGALQEGADAQIQESQDRAMSLARERDRGRDYEAALKEQYELRQREMLQRQKEVEQYTQKYTNDLADRGAFWHNPQNVISAIGAALMQLTTDDRSFGYKLLNGAIQSDLQNRRSLADQHLGYLKSNMGEYDKIAGDRISGMQLAELESKRVAAIELERIAAQFQGPKAKANAAAISAKLWQEVRQGFMEFYNRHLYVRPHREDPGVLANYKLGGAAEPSVGYTPFADPKNPRAGQPGVFEQTGPSAQRVPGGAMGAGNGAMGAGNGGQPQGAAPGPAAGGLPGMPWLKGLSTEQKQAFNDRYPGYGAQIVETAAIMSANEAYRDAGVRPGTPPHLMTKAQQDAFNASKASQHKAAMEEVKNMAGALTQSAGMRQGIRSIKTDMAMLEASIAKLNERGLKITIDDVLSTKTKSVFGSSTTLKWQNIYSAWAKLNPDKASQYEATRDAIATAGERLNQLIAGRINDHYKEQGGAAITAIELPRLEQYASAGMRYSALKNFFKDQEDQWQRKEREQLITLRPMAAARWIQGVGVGSKKLDAQSLRAYEPGDQETRTPKTPNARFTPKGK